VHAHPLPATADSQEALVVMIITLAPRLLHGALVQLPLLGFQDPALLRTHRHIMLPLQVFLMEVLPLPITQHQLLVLTMLPHQEPWMVLRLGHTAITGRLVVP
jgi:hypothetical protein